MSASDGNGLIRLTEGHDSVPVYSPDGTQVAFFRTKVGINPDGAGAIFVVNTNGTGLRRVTPWGWAFLHESWSPDGQWIAFQKPYGELYLVHRTGPACIRCRSPCRPAWGRWTPSGRPTARGSCSRRRTANTSTIWAAHPDGSGLQQITDVPGAQLSLPDWRP